MATTLVPTSRLLLLLLLVSSSASCCSSWKCLGCPVFEIAAKIQTTKSARQIRHGCYIPSGFQNLNHIGHAFL